MKIIKEHYYIHYKTQHSNMNVMWPSVCLCICVCLHTVVHHSLWGPSWVLGHDSIDILFHCTSLSFTCPYFSILSFNLHYITLLSFILLHFITFYFSLLCSAVLHLTWCPCILHYFNIHNNVIWFTSLYLNFAFLHFTSFHYMIPCFPSL